MTLKPRTKRTIRATLGLALIVLVMAYGYWAKTKPTGTNQAPETVPYTDQEETQPHDQRGTTISQQEPAQSNENPGNAHSAHGIGPTPSHQEACANVAAPAFRAWITSPETPENFCPYLSATGILWQQESPILLPQTITQEPYLMELGQHNENVIHCEASTDRAIWLITLTRTDNAWQVDGILPNTVQALQTEDQ